MLDRLWCPIAALLWCVLATGAIGPPLAASAQPPERVRDGQDAAAPSARTPLDAKGANRPPVEEEEEVPPFVTRQLRTVLVDESEAGNPRSYFKPGHWTALQGSWTSTQADFAGELVAAPYSGRGVLQLDASRDDLRVSRPVSLPKGQGKLLDTTLYFPGLPQRVASIQWLLEHPNGNQAWEVYTTAVAMLPHQYFFVVLSQQPDQFGFVRQLPAMNSSTFLTTGGLLDAANSPNSGAIAGSYRDYIIVFTSASRRTVALPSSSECWTSIAYVLWDDLDPTVLTAAQQQAMLDWLHWGGQLVLASPRSLDRLQGSFLEPVLPAQSGSTRKMTQEDLEPINAWAAAIHVDGNTSSRLELPSASTIERTTLTSLDRSRPVPLSGNLLHERRVGRGRVVIAEFSLAQLDATVKNWPAFDAFWNAMVLGRPARHFYDNQDQATMRWKVLPEGPADPRTATRVRIFARDVESAVEIIPSNEARAQRDYEIAGYGVHAQAGVGGWNEFSGCAAEARTMLNFASGIDVPSRAFVAALLFSYLVLLVPVNWAIFRILGRVEWAWMMTPVLAVAGAATVARLAQLDIGFVRSETEVAVIELQHDYARGHVSRFAGLYTSLSTPYQIEFSGLNAVAKSFPLSDQPSTFQPPWSMTMDRARDTRLSGINVTSNSTGMFHSEQFVDLPGTMALTTTGPQRYLLRNDTGLAIRDPTLVGRDESDRVVWTRFRQLADQSSVSLVLTPVGEQGLVPESLVSDGPDDLDPSTLMWLAANPGRLRPGQLVLVGWTDEAVGAMKIEPAASQHRNCTVIVAQLSAGWGPDPEPDANLLRDVVRRLEEGLELDEAELLNEDPASLGL